MLFLAMMTASILPCLLLSLLYISMIRMIDGSWLTVIRLLRLMQWFVLPMLLLHALLSPGQLLMPHTWLPMTREGMMLGLRLSLHLSAVFFAAMLMFRLLKQAEWLSLILLLPWLGQRLVIYVWMLRSMKMNITTLLGDLRWQFRLRKDLKRFPLLLMAAFKQTLSAAHGHACMLWLRWPQRLPLKTSTGHTRMCPPWLYHLNSGLAASLGAVAFVMPWL